MSKNLKKYQKPQVFSLEVENEELICFSGNRPSKPGEHRPHCDCTQYKLWKGCNNCDPHICNCGECNYRP